MPDAVLRANSTPEEPQSAWVEAGALLGLGLYAARIAAESLPGVRTAAQLVFLVMVGVVTSWFFTRALTRLRIRHAELGLLLVYVLWPFLNQSVAWAVGLLALGMWLWRMRHLTSPGLEAGILWLPEVGAGLAGLWLFGSTVAPGMLPADAGEFQIVGSTLGIAHPPGYPLYTLMAWVATAIPVGDPAFRVNLLSVLFASLTLVVLARVVRRVSLKTAGSRGVAWSAALAAAALISSPTFWVQATTANIRSLTGLFTAALLLYAVRYVEEPSNWRLARLALVFGLAVGHHSSLVLLAVPLGLYLLVSRPRQPGHPFRWLGAAGAFAASLMVLAYLPLRSMMAPAFDPVPVTSMARFVDHVLALGFRGDMLYLDSWPGFVERVGVYLQILRLQFGGWLPWAMLLGLAGLVWRDWRAAILMGGVWLVNALSAITYRAPQTVEYLLPSYVAMAAALGCGLRLIVERMPQRKRTGLLLSLVSILLVRQALVTWPDMRAQHVDTSTRAAAERLLRQAPQDALILANWHNATPLWYLQLVEGQRDDVEVQYVYPEGDLDNAEVWLRRISASVVQRPVVVTNRFYEYENSNLVFEPLGDAWVARIQPSAAPPDSATRVALTLGDRIRVDAATAPDRGSPGEMLLVNLYWRPTVRLDRDYSVFVQLVGPNGVVGQADRLQATSTFPAGKERSDSYELPLLLQTPPGSYELIAGFYTSTDTGWERLTTSAGIDHVTIGRVVVAPGSQQAATLHPMSVAYEGGLALQGTDVDRSVEGWTRLYLHCSQTDGAIGGEARQITALGEDGAVLAQTALPALAEDRTAVVALDLPGAPQVVYLTLTGARAEVLHPLTVWRLPGAEALRLRVPPGEVRYVPLGGQMVFVDMARRQDSVVSGQALTVRPRMLALRRLDRDVSLSIGVSMSEGSLEAKSDGTPALGAIPTLKWLTGWPVTSLYEPVIGSEWPAGPARVTLEGYDAFTLAPLAVLDERLVREGQGTYLVIDSVEVVSP